MSYVNKEGEGEVEERWRRKRFIGEGYLFLIFIFVLRQPNIWLFGRHSKLRATRIGTLRTRFFDWFLQLSFLSLSSSPQSRRLVVFHKSKTTLFRALSYPLNLSTSIKQLVFLFFLLFCLPSYENGWAGWAPKLWETEWAFGRNTSSIIIIIIFIM